MQLTIIGCSDAFGSGGRYHSCYLLDTSQGRLMIDCGANAPLGLKRANISLATVDAIVITHCHGDHFGGLPFLFLDGLFISKREAPLEIIGPPGIEARMTVLMESMYPGLIDFPRNFELIFRELAPGEDIEWRGLPLNGYEMAHFSGSPSLSVRIEDDGKRFAFSGDSGWCDGVADAGRGATLYLIECTAYAMKTDMHLDYLTLATKFDEIGAERYLLTHMGEEMLAQRDKIDLSLCLLAEDGMTLKI